MQNTVWSWPAILPPSLLQLCFYGPSNTSLYKNALKNTYSNYSHLLYIHYNGQQALREFGQNEAKFTLKTLLNSEWYIPKYTLDVLPWN